MTDSSDARSDEKILFRFDKPRRFQEDFIQDVYSSVKEGKHLIAHAPTGIGNTSASLGPAITYALKKGLTVFFVTPK
ncbi:MAG: hypothetical protein GOV15_00925, partial [Candidatus Diapherotrites archaeon]|nr:hypothetical protein [Candidatus Diapherotrites archaeon]